MDTFFDPEELHLKIEIKTNMKDYPSSKSQQLKIVVPCTKTYDFILVSDIIRCEGMQNYTRLFLKTGKSIVSSCNIGLYKKVLASYDFFTCHKSHLVNKTQIVRYHKEGQIEMSDKSLVPVARRRKESFMDDILKQHDVVSVNGQKE